MAEQDNNQGAGAEGAEVTKQDVNTGSEKVVLTQLNRKQNLQKAKGKKVSIRSLVGRLVNPNNEDEFNGEPSKPVEIDSWIQLQIDNDKLEIVED